MKKKNFLAGVTALLISVSCPAFFMHEDKVYCEKIYDVKLSVDTVEVDINSIPENREVQVGVNIENNPGFLGMSFLIELDSRIEYDEYKLFYNENKVTIDYGMYKNGKVIDITAGNRDIESLYEDNGAFCYMTLKIPEDCKSGDYYSIRPFLSYQGENREYNAHINRENSFDTIMGRENFAEPVAGGIRIVGEQHQEQPSTQEPEQNNPEPPQPSEQPVQQNQDNNSQQNENMPENTESLVKGEETTVSSQTSVSETALTTTVTSAPETKVSTVSGTSCSETVSASETDITEKVTEPQAGRKSGKTGVIAVITSLIIAGASFIVYRTRRKKN